MLPDLMELSGVELSFLINEIKAKVTRGYYVSAITPITGNSFLFKLHHTTEPDIMLMIATMGIWITRLKFKPLEHNDLGEIIKTNLERSKIEAIHQPGSERIAIFSFNHPTNSLRVLVVELFAEGNLILCDENMSILAILRPIEVKHRTLRVGTFYRLPRAGERMYLAYPRMNSLIQEIMLNYPVFPSLSGLVELHLCQENSSRKLCTDLALWQKMWGI